MMNVIVIMLDSLRQDYVSCYGRRSKSVRTSNIDAFADEAVIFDNVYPENLPTLPVRTDLMTGMCSLTNRAWQPLVPTDIPAARIFRRENYLTAMVADTYHLFKPNMNFHESFDIFHWIRGAEYDAVRSGRSGHLDLKDYVTDQIPKEWLGTVAVALGNLQGRTEPEDFPCWNTITKSLEVLEQARNTAQPLFMWIDTFQNHEPWCPPAKFDIFGDPGYKGPKIVMPPGGAANSWATDEQIERIKSLYAGEVAYADYCLGRLFAGMRQMGYFDDSVIVLLADHGHPLCDHGKFLKGPDRMYSELLKVPFIIRPPGGQPGGRRVSGLGRFADLLPTMLDLAGLGNNTGCMAGVSLKRLIKDNGKSAYAATISGYFGGIDRCIRNEQYSYIIRPAGEKDELYDLSADMLEKNNIIDEKPEVAKNLLAQFGAIYFPEQYKYRGLQGRFEVAGTALD